MPRHPTIRIATWNLDHASNFSRPINLQIKTIRSIAADIIILTETCAEVDLRSLGYGAPLCTTPKKNGKFCTAVWSKFPTLRTLPTYDATHAVCVEMLTPLGTILVYGTIITYHGNRGPAKDLPYWHEHMQSIRLHGEDWRKLVSEEPTTPLIVGGDFNQTRDGSKRYCSKGGENIILLTEELERANLHCLTEEDFGKSGKLKVDPRKGYHRHNIDHICVTRGAFEVRSVGAWDHFTETNTFLTDHNGVFVDFTQTNDSPWP